MVVSTLHILGGDCINFTYNLYILNAYYMSAVVYCECETVNG